MSYDIIVGRNSADKKELGERGLIFLGKGLNTSFPYQGWNRRSDKPYLSALAGQSQAPHIEVTHSLRSRYWDRRWGVLRRSPHSPLYMVARVASA